MSDDPNARRAEIAATLAMLAPFRLATYEDSRLGIAVTFQPDEPAQPEPMKSSTTRKDEPEERVNRAAGRLVPRADVSDRR